MSLSAALVVVCAVGASVAGAPTRLLTLPELNAEGLATFSARLEDGRLHVDVIDDAGVVFATLLVEPMRGDSRAMTVLREPDSLRVTWNAQTLEYTIETDGGLVATVEFRDGRWTADALSRRLVGEYGDLLRIASLVHLQLKQEWSDLRRVLGSDVDFVPECQPLERQSIGPSGSGTNVCAGDRREFYGTRLGTGSVVANGLCSDLDQQATSWCTNGICLGCYDKTSCNCTPEFRVPPQTFCSIWATRCRSCN